MRCKKWCGKSASASAFDIFLSHSYLDKELVLGILEYLEGMGQVVVRGLEAGISSCEPGKRDERNGSGGQKTDRACQQVAVFCDHGGCKGFQMDALGAWVHGWQERKIQLSCRSSPRESA